MCAKRLVTYGRTANYLVTLSMRTVNIQIGFLENVEYTTMLYVCVCVAAHSCVWSIRL